MADVIQFPIGAPARVGFQRVQSTYTAREISRQFGISEHYIRRWTRDGLIQTVPVSEGGEARYDFRALKEFRRVRVLRGQGLTLRQIDAELRGQLNLFQETQGRLIQLPVQRGPFEEALLMHECGDQRAAALYRKAIFEGDSIADAHCNLGILEFDAGNTPEAFNQFTHSLKDDPRHFESHFNLANLYFETGDLRLARLHYEIAAEMEPSCADLLFNLGLVHVMNGDLNAAVTVLRKAKDLASEDEAGKVRELLASIVKIMKK